jgi:Mrp family chromosome partitioning ATPase
MSECTHDCASCAKKNESGGCSSASAEPASFLVKPNAASRVKRVVAVMSGKGGVGKSLLYPCKNRPDDGFINRV